MSRDNAFYINMLCSGMWHGISGGWTIIFIIAGTLSKASTSVFKADKFVVD